AETVADGVVRRLLRDEREARERAEKVFRLVERECPLPLRRFSRQELWEAIYLGHRQNARSAPILPDVPGLDIRDYLCGETIEGRGLPRQPRPPPCGDRLDVPPAAACDYGRCSAGADVESRAQLSPHRRRRICLPRPAQGHEASRPEDTPGSPLVH